MVKNGEWVREQRKLLGLSQAKLGAELGVSQAVVSQWERNQRKPNAAQLATLPSRGCSLRRPRAMRRSGIRSARISSTVWFKRRTGRWASRPKLIYTDANPEMSREL